MTTPQLASSLQALRDRGVTNPDEFALLGAERLAETVQWFDAQQGRVTAGVLVAELRNGGRQQRVRKAASLTDREAEYGRQIAAWLERELPDVCDGHHGPHPAAVAAVIRLHHEHGRGLTKTRHGARIRAFIRSWEERLLDPADRWFTNQSREQAA